MLLPRTTGVVVAGSSLLMLLGLYVFKPHSPKADLPVAVRDDETAPPSAKQAGKPSLRHAKWGQPNRGTTDDDADTTAGYDGDSDTEMHPWTMQFGTAVRASPHTIPLRPGEGPAGRACWAFPRAPCPFWPPALRLPDRALVRVSDVPRVP